MPDWDDRTISQRKRGDCRVDGNGIGDPLGVRFNGERMCLIGDLWI